MPRGQPTPQTKRLFESPAPSTKDSHGLPEEIQEVVKDVRGIVVADAYIAREASTEVVRRVRQGEFKDQKKWPTMKLIEAHQKTERSVSGWLASLSAAQGQGVGGDTNIYMVIEAPPGSDVSAMQENYPGVTISVGPQQVSEDQDSQVEADTLPSGSDGGEGASDSDEGGRSIF